MLGTLNTDNISLFQIGETLLTNKHFVFVVKKIFNIKMAYYNVPNLCHTILFLFKKKVNLNLFFNDSGFWKVYQQNMIVNSNMIKHKPIVLISKKDRLFQKKRFVCLKEIKTLSS